MSEKKRATPGYLEVIVIALIVAAGALFAYDRMFAQKIKVVDLKGFIRTQKALLKAGEITKKQWQASLDAMDRFLAEEADKHRNEVILLKDVVLKNGSEITQK